MSSGDIPDSSITASSYHTHVEYDREPKYARLGWNKFWASGWSSDPDPWIQVDLGTCHNVTGLQTEGRHTSDEWHYWVEQIKVQVGMAENELSFIGDGQGQAKVC